MVIVPGLFLLLFQTACTTTTTAGYRPARNPGRVEVGGIVRILVKGGKVHEFEVVALTLTSIIGADVEVFSEDITRVDIRETDGWRRTNVTVASILGAPLLFVDGYALSSIASATGAGQ
jgi:hypothetical protein